MRGLAAGGLTAAVAYRAVAAAMSSRPPAGLRTNHRGREVSLAAGPAVVAGTLAGTAAACPSGGARQLRASLIAVLTAAAAGGYDDLAGTSHARGLRGHLGALLDGEVTTGSAKIVGIGVGALSAARGLGGSGGDVLLATGLIAGTANLANLLDLRPGRAGKEHGDGPPPASPGRPRRCCRLTSVSASCSATRAQTHSVRPWARPSPRRLTVRRGQSCSPPSSR